MANKWTHKKYQPFFKHFFYIIFYAYLLLSAHAKRLSVCRMSNFVTLYRLNCDKKVIILFWLEIKKFFTRTMITHFEFERRFDSRRLEQGIKSPSIQNLVWNKAKFLPCYQILEWTTGVQNILFWLLEVTKVVTKYDNERTQNIYFFYIVPFFAQLDCQNIVAEKKVWYLKVFDFHQYKNV